MRQIIKNIFSFYLIASLTLGGVGIELFKHVCLSHSFNSVSIVDKPKCDHQHSQIHQSDNCCIETIEQISCCEIYDNLNSEKVPAITNSEQCCESYSELKKIDELLFPPIEKKILTGFTHFINIQTIDLVDNSSELKFNNHNNDFTPPVYGRNLLNSIHQLKIDTPVC